MVREKHAGRSEVFVRSRVYAFPFADISYHAYGHRDNVGMWNGLQRRSWAIPVRGPCTARARATAELALTLHRWERERRREARVVPVHTRCFQCWPVGRARNSWVVLGILSRVQGMRMGDGAGLG